MSLNVCSNEILSEVLSYLGTKDLHSVSLSSCHLHALAESLLYSSFVQTGSKSIQLFLRTLTQSPELARHVKHFLGDDNWVYTEREQYDEYDDRYFQPDDNLQGKTLGRAWIQEQFATGALELSKVQTWHQQLCEEQHWEPAAAFVLLLCADSLQSIKFSAYGSEVAGWIDSLFEDAIAVQRSLAHRPLFSNLRSLEIMGWTGAGPIKLEHIMHYLRLGCLDHFMASDIGCDSIIYGLQSSDCFNVKTLSLKKSSLPRVVNEIFLSDFHSLERLEYEHNHSRWVSTRFDYLDPQSFIRGLESSKHTLQELVLRAVESEEMECQRFPFTRRERVGLGSMSDFTSLRMLDTWSTVIFGTETPHFNTFGLVNGAPEIAQLKTQDYSFAYAIGPDGRDFLLSCVCNLPPNLERLVIRKCTTSIYAFLFLVFEDRSLLLSSLRSLTIEFHWFFDMNTLYTMHGNTKWEAEALRRGLELTFSQEPPRTWVE